MKPNQPDTIQTRQRTFFRWMTTGLVALVLSTASIAFAQATGTVTGRVLDTSTGKYLEGAEINIGENRTATERDGTFTLRNVPEGAAKVTVNYPGLETSENDVAVKAGESVNVDIKLAAQEIITLGEFKIEGSKEGMAQAVALQKVAIQAKLVTAGDQFGAISEGNVGEYLKYLPGVGVDYNVNDARGVSLRGLKTNFTIVAVDGTPMASASSGAANRRFELEQINSTNVETTEVYKMLLPDAPADATGGYINMVTKSAFDRQDIQRIEYDFSFLVPSSRLGDSLSSQAGTWGSGEHYVTRPNLTMNYARRLNDKFGFNVSYKLSERYDDSPRTEYTWVTTGAVASGTPLSLLDPTLTSYFQNNEQKLTHRQSFSAKIDYNISDSTKLTFSGQWNWYDLTFTQRGMFFTFGTTGINNMPGIEDNRAANGGRSIEKRSFQRRKYGTTTHFNTVLRHEFSDRSSASLTGYWSQADSKYRDHTSGFLAQAYGTYVGNPDFTISQVVSSEKNPGVAVTGASQASLQNLNNYTLNITGGTPRARPNTALDTKSGVQGHYKYELDTAVPITLQVGTAFDKVTRGITEQQFNYNGSNTYAGSLSSLAADYNFDYGYNYGSGPVLDLYKTFQALQDLTLYNKNPNTWNVTRFEEDNLAGYFRADAVFFKDLTVAGGARYEKHNLDATRKAVLSAASRNVPVDMEYNDIYPSITAKYQPTRQWIFRAGASKTVGHPDYAEVLPNINYSDAGTSINVTVPSKNLEPYSVTNLDVSAEYYFSKSGLVSASVFRKNVEGFISSQNVTDAAEQLAILQDIDPTTFGGTTSLPTNSIVRTWVNGNSSTVEGIELMYNQTLSFLPTPFNGLNLQINWSKMDVDADDLTTQYAQELAANLQTFNVAIGYRQKKFSTQVSANWTDDKLIGTGASGGTLNWYQAPDWKMNITAKYEFSRHYAAYVNVSNLFSKRTEYYKGSAYGMQDIALPFRKFEFGYPHISIGVKGTF